MYVNRKTNVTLLLFGFTIAMLASSMGCRTGGFTKPDMGKLAFWKSENSIFASKSQKMPPPPARHFDPAPIEGEMESQVATYDDDKQRFRNDITEMRAEIDAAANSISKPLTNPIRKPYSDTKDAVSELASNAASSFESQTSAAKSKLDQFKGEVNSGLNAGLNSAQNDFQAAMSTTKQTVDSAIDSTSNDFAPTRSVAKSANDMTQGWKDNLAIPTDISNAKSKIDQSLAAVSDAMYDVNGKLVSSKSSAVDQFKEKVSSFQQDVVTPKMNAAAQTSNDFQAGIANKVAQIADAGNSFATGTTNSTNAQPIEMPITGFGSTTSNAAPTQPDLKLVQAQMEEAKRQIEELKKQIAIRDQAPVAPISSPSSSNTNSGSTNSQMNIQSGERVAQLQAPGIGGQFGPSANHSSMVQSNSSTLNPLRSLQTQSSSQLNSGQPLAPAQTTTPGYPSTSHGQYNPRSNDFSGNFAPMSAPSVGGSGSAQVGFDSTGNKSMVVTTNNATSSLGTGKIKNHVSDVDIPNAILTGSGSYAPGSVQPLQSGK
jgi:hypothetical protein